MRGVTPTLHCDAEVGCDDWTVDYYATDAYSVDGVRLTLTERAPGWRSNDKDEDLCPEHAQVSQTATPHPPLGGKGCVCNLPNGLANHNDESCPHWVEVL